MNVNKINIIVDPHFGRSIYNLPIEETIWIVDSDDNHSVIQDVRKKNQLPNITSFQFDIKDTPEDLFINQFDMIDLHHGKYSHTPPYTIINVIGVKWSDRIGKELNRYGFINHVTTKDGFISERTIN